MIKKTTIVTLGLVALVSLAGCKFGQDSQKIHQMLWRVHKQIKI